MCGCEHRVYMWDSTTSEPVDKLTNTCRDRISLYDVSSNRKYTVRCLFGSNVVEVNNTVYKLFSLQLSKITLRYNKIRQ